MNTPLLDPQFTLERREFTFRATEVAAEGNLIRGIAVPYEKPVRIRDWAGEYDEQFARNSVDDDGALAFWRHYDPIGKLESGTDAPEGRLVELRISDTALGRDALTLARDGAVTQLSVGFELGGDYEVEEREDDVPLITRTRVKVREVSLVPFGAYGPDASITDVRHLQQPTRKENSMSPTTTAEAPADERLEILTRDIGEVRELSERLERQVALIPTRDDSPTGGDPRSAGQFVLDLVRGDTEAAAAYNRAMEHRFDELQHRAYGGGTTADAPVKDGWVGDLTRIFDSSSGVLSEIYSTGTLPGTGMNIEYAELLANTVAFTEQEDEGDDLGYGKVTLKMSTAPVLTYGGFVQLTRQQIERSTLPVLSRSLEALTVAAAARKKAALRAAHAALITARKAVAANGGVVVLGAVLASATASQWEDALVDAAIRFDAENVAPEVMIVSATVFKKLRSLTVSGERVFQVASDNASGTLNLPGLSGNFAGIPVRLDPGQAGDEAVIVNGRAIRQYDSALVQLQDENVINLSKDFSAYRYGAVAAEVPQLLVPIKLAAS